jgi:hypothetical protein
MTLDETDEMCRCCRGQKVIEGPAIVGRVCPQCSGKGYTDWVTHAMDRRSSEPPDHRLLYNITLRNIDILKNEILEQGRQIGMHIDIRLDMKNEHQFEREYMLRPSPMLIPNDPNFS